MIKNLRTYSSVLSSTLLASFLLALGGVLFCQFEEILEPNHHVTNHHTKVDDGSHDSTNNHTAHARGEETEKHSHDHNESECCNEQTDTFFAGLVKQEQSKFSFVKNLLPFETLISASGIYLNLGTFFNIRFNVILGSLPPPQISDIRIAVQSFLI